MPKLCRNWSLSSSRSSIPPRYSTACPMLPSSKLRPISTLIQKLILWLVLNFLFSLLFLLFYNLEKMEYNKKLYFFLGGFLIKTLTFEDIVLRAENLLRVAALLHQFMDSFLYWFRWSERAKEEKKRKNKIKTFFNDFLITSHKKLTSLQNWLLKLFFETASSDCKKLAKNKKIKE